MDVRTSQILEALDPLGADLLLRLLQRPIAEKDLLRLVEHATQPTGHRRLRRLAKAGLIRRGGGPHARGRPWILVAPRETESVLTALLDLADRLEESDQVDRLTAREVLPGFDPRRKLRVLDNEGRK
jgi:DNA-binding MarR family transcriptional regulator